MSKHVILLLAFALGSCSSPGGEHKTEGSTLQPIDTLKADPVATQEKVVKINDSLNEMALLISGQASPSDLYREARTKQEYLDFSESFSKKWNDFDSTRMRKLKEFRDKELMKEDGYEKTVFYPFSGPDILYADLFFPGAERFVLVGLEPVGTPPDFTTGKHDSLGRYYHKLNTSLNAILKFSFFRTESMSTDLKNTEVDGTIHLLFLFLSRTGNAIVSAKPVTIDSTGNKIYLASFGELKTAKLRTKGVEIFYRAPSGKLKELNYYSLNAADHGLKNNAGFTSYLKNLGNFSVYLKGASYLLHKPTFSVIRTILLENASTVTQDDSGLAVRYLLNDKNEWRYRLFGEYSKPIHMFSKHYQPALDSLYKKQGATKTDFGLGYNYKDKNSNFMVAVKKR